MPWEYRVGGRIFKSSTKLSQEEIDELSEQKQPVEPTMFDRFMETVGETAKPVRRFMRSVGDYVSAPMSQESINRMSQTSRTGYPSTLKPGETPEFPGFMGGVVGGVGDIESGQDIQGIGQMLNPLDVVGMSTGLGAGKLYGAVKNLNKGLATARNAEKLMGAAKALDITSRATAIPQIAHGGWKAAKLDSSLPERAYGVAEMIMGGLGTQSNLPEIPKKVKGPDVSPTVEPVFGEKPRVRQTATGAIVRSDFPENSVTFPDPFTAKVHQATPETIRKLRQEGFTSGGVDPDGIPFMTKPRPSGPPNIPPPATPNIPQPPGTSATQTGPSSFNVNLTEPNIIPDPRDPRVAPPPTAVPNVPPPSGVPGPEVLPQAPNVPPPQFQNAIPPSRPTLNPETFGQPTNVVDVNAEIARVREEAQREVMEELGISPEEAAARRGQGLQERAAEETPFTPVQEPAPAQTFAEQVVPPTVAETIAKVKEARTTPVEPAPIPVQAAPPIEPAVVPTKKKGPQRFKTQPVVTPPGKVSEQLAPPTLDKLNEAKVGLDKFKQTNEITDLLNAARAVGIDPSMAHTQDDLIRAIEGKIAPVGKPKLVKTSKGVAMRPGEVMGSTIPLKDDVSHEMAPSSVAENIAKFRKYSKAPMEERALDPIFRTDLKATLKELGKHSIIQRGEKGITVQLENGQNVKIPFKDTTASQVYNASRGLISAFDLSAPLRQGLPLIGTMEWWKAFAPMFKSGWSEEAFRAIKSDIRNQAYFKPREKIVYDRKLGQQVIRERGSFAEETAGLRLSDADGNLSVREEMATGGLAERIKFLGIGKGVRASNRAYSAYLDSLRVATFNNMMEAATKADLNPTKNLEVAKSIAEFINDATGRGSLKQKVSWKSGGEWQSKEFSAEPAAKILANVFFSPRLMAARVRYMNPGNYVFQNEVVRKQYLKSLAAMSAANVTALGLMSAMGADVSFDPTSTDFLKARVGNTRFDFGGGFLQYLSAFSRMAIGQKTTDTGRREMGAGFNAPTKFDTGMEFGINKLHPLAKFAVDLARASQYHKFNVADRTLALFVPAVAQDMAELMQTDPDMRKWFAIPASMFGAGTNTYDIGGTESKIIPKEWDWQYQGGSPFDINTIPQDPYQP